MTWKDVIDAHMDWLGDTGGPHDQLDNAELLAGGQPTGTRFRLLLDDHERELVFSEGGSHAQAGDMLTGVVDPDEVDLRKGAVFRWRDATWQVLAADPQHGLGNVVLAIDIAATRVESTG